MADDRHYVPGDFYRICDRTGFKTRASKTAKEWTGRIVRTDVWEPRQPQDFVRGVTDDQTVPDPRPRQIDLFVGPLQTTVAVKALAGATILTVALTTRMAAGDRLYIILDNKDTFIGTINSISSSVTLVLTAPLPYSTSVGNVITDIDANAVVGIGRAFSQGFNAGFS